MVHENVIQRFNRMCAEQREDLESEHDYYPMTRVERARYMLTGYLHAYLGVVMFPEGTLGRGSWEPGKPS